MGELKEKERQLQEKERELSNVKRKCAQFEAKNDELTFAFEMYKKANPISRIKTMPPSKIPANMSGVEEEETDCLAQPKNQREVELLIKNSELGHLATQRQSLIEKLKKEKSELEARLLILEDEVGPLKEKQIENLNKIHDQITSLNMKKKQLDRAQAENKELRTEKDNIERQLKSEQSRTKDQRALLSDLPKIKITLQERDKEILTLKEKLHQCEETITKAAAQRTPSPMKVDMHQRNSDRKKINELENKIEELTAKVDNAQPLRQKLLEANNDIRRLRKQLNSVNSENFKLKSAKQQLQESLDIRQKELESEWHSNSSELEKAHARINKLQQDKTSLKEEIERLTPPPFSRTPSPAKPLSPLVTTSISSPPHITVRPPTSPPPPMLHMTYDDDEFGSQWSLVSNDTIEQLEYDKDEISIKYEELKMEYGKTKGQYNILLERTRQLQANSQIIMKERLQMEKEMNLMQVKCQNEFDVDREKNLREKLANNKLTISKLNGQLEEQKQNFEQDITSMREKMKELEQQLSEQKDNDNETLGRYTDELDRAKQQIMQLNREIAEKDGQLEGERVVVSSLQQQLRHHKRTTPSPMKFPSSSPLQKRLESAESVTHKIHEAIQLETVSPSPSCNNLIQQLQGILTEAKDLVHEQSNITNELAYSSPMADPLSPAKKPTSHISRDGGIEETDIGILQDVPLVNENQMKNEKFQKWLTQFESEKVILKSRIGDLEQRLSEGSHKVLELQGLVGELEERLSVEQSQNASMFEQHYSQLPPHHMNEVSRAMKNTQRAIRQGQMEKVKEKMNKLEHKVNNLLQAAYNISDITHSSKMTSSPYYDDNELTSLSPSPIKSAPITTPSTLAVPPPYHYPMHTISPTTISPPKHTLSVSPTCSSPVALTQAQPSASKSDCEPRLFVALLNYNPKSMCSTGHPERELTLHTGDVIPIVGEMDDFGYYRSVVDGKELLVPSCFIQEIKLDDKAVQERLMNQSLNTRSFGSESEVEVGRHVTTTDTIVTHLFPVNSPSSDGLTKHFPAEKIISASLEISPPSSLSPPIEALSEEELPVFKPKYVKALFDYTPAADSPNPQPELELEFVKGDIIKIIGKMRKDKFYEGELNKKRGYVPSNFVTDIVST
jgi:predicted  nucleic acid-binding Zn-ribbon protein